MMKIHSLASFSFGFILITLFMQTVSTENTYEFHFQFDADVEYKDIKCVIVRLKDITSNEIVDHTKFINYGRGYYSDKIIFVFQNSADNYMDHDYDLTAILNVEWCSADNGGEPRTRVGDMKARKMTAVYGKAKDKEFMHYIIDVEMEHVK